VHASVAWPWAAWRARPAASSPYISSVTARKGSLRDEKKRNGTSSFYHKSSSCKTWRLPPPALSMNGGRVRVTKNHTYIIMGIHAGFDSTNDARAPMPTLLRNASGLSRFGPVGLFPEYGPRAVFDRLLRSVHPLATRTAAHAWNTCLILPRRLHCTASGERTCSHVRAFTSCTKQGVRAGCAVVVSQDRASTASCLQLV
jgi:hypothetical protein